VKVQITHTVAITVEEHTPEQARVRAALDGLNYVSFTSDRHGGDVTYRIDADDMDDIVRICRAVGQ